MTNRMDGRSFVMAAAVCLLAGLAPGAADGQNPDTEREVSGPSAVALPLEPEYGTVASADGTRIGYCKYGRGPAVVVCHGTHTVADDWSAFAKELGRRRTVYLFDRRGRGESPDDGKQYTRESEIDDLAALVKVAGPGTAILGHSFGGGVALAYALRDGFQGRLVLYEPGHSAVQKVSRGKIPDLQALIDRDELEKAAEFGMHEIGGMPRAEIAKLKQSPLWPTMVQLNRLFPRELSFLDQLDWSRDELTKLQCRTWMLLGSLTEPPKGEVSRTAALVDRIPGVTLYPLMGQGHVAYLSDPPLLAKTVERCLTDE